MVYFQEKVKEWRLVKFIRVRKMWNLVVCGELAVTQLKNRGTGAVVVLGNLSFCSMVVSGRMCAEKDGNSGTDGRTSSSRSSYRSRRGRVSSVVVVEVNKENLNTVWPYLLICIKNATFISLDLELSGLGMQKGWLAKSLEERYDVIRRSAQSRSVLSVGISTFQLVSLKETDTRKKLKYKCQVFNILTLCLAPFIVEPDGLQFLSKHKFDFNRWINCGVTYDSTTEKGSTMRTLWREILCASVPITLHNGLIDLVFIYQHFYSVLPETFTEFVANISDWFLLPESIPGLYDSKYIAEYINRFKASFLEYVFRKCQRENAFEETQNRLYINMEFDFALANSALKGAIDVVDCKLPDGFYETPIQQSTVSDDLKKLLCKRYSNFGYCRAVNCSYVHDVDILLNLEEQKQSKIRERRKRRYDYESKLAECEDDHNGGESTSSSVDRRSDADSKNSALDEPSTQNESAVTATLSTIKTDLQRSVTGCHRAGVDSFMTGFAVAFMQRMNILRTRNFSKECGNRISLPGKMAPMIIHRSDYVQSADDHIAKWSEIERERSRRAAQQVLATSED